MVGNVGVGGDNPVRAQSMIIKETTDTKGAVNEIINIRRKGADYVRVTVNSISAAENIGELKRVTKEVFGEDIPLVADIHHQGSGLAIMSARMGADKVRVNPGLLTFHKKTEMKGDYAQWEIDKELGEIETALLPIIQACKDNGASMRIGVNEGSESNRLKVMHGAGPRGMVESAMEYIKICEANDFRELIISVKASDVPTMVRANLLMVERMDEEGMDYPIHLGVTEAGGGQ